jgi:hypothetical protein
LEVLLNILKWTVEKETTDFEWARNCSLYLFYATYSPFPGDETTQKGMNHLIKELSFPETAVDILCRIDSVALALSLIRNLHNMAVSFQGAAKSILDIRIQLNPSSSTAPWLSRNDEPLITFVSICTSIASWSLVEAQPDFPGGDPDDKRSELMVEILNAFYALRVGLQLKESNSTSNSSVQGNLALADLVIRILKLSRPSDSLTATVSDTIEKRIKQCKLATVSLLMDSDPSFGKQILQSHSINNLLEILTNQVNDVVDNTKVDGSAVASLVPILALLNKYSMGNSDFRQQVRNSVFPPDLEEQFQEKVKGITTSSNMSPLDAPKDTLRGKLVTLLSWAESYIKRCAAELLWTICNSDATEYVHRVGLGNALPLLNAKGLASMPVPR